MTSLQTPDLSAEVEVGSFGVKTEQAVAGIAIGALGLLWFLRLAFPTP